MNKYTIEYRRKTGCTMGAGMKDLEAKDEKDAERLFFQEIVKEYPISDFEIIRIVKGV